MGGRLDNIRGQGLSVQECFWGIPPLLKQYHIFSTFTDIHNDIHCEQNDIHWHSQIYIKGKYVFPLYKFVYVSECRFVRSFISLSGGKFFSLRDLLGEPFFSGTF